jgi:hypothetical protein
MEPPYEFAPKELPPLAELVALQLEHDEPLTCTEISLAEVAPHMLLLLDRATLTLHEYAPTCNTLMEPPYEFAPKELPTLVELSALQLEHDELLTWTETMLTEVAPHMLLLLLETAELKLQEYAPTCIRLMKPPYEFAPKKPTGTFESLIPAELQLKHSEPLTCTETSPTEVDPLVLLESVLLKLQQYAPTCNKLMEPPYEFDPLEFDPMVDVKAMALKDETFSTRARIPLAVVEPHVLALFPPLEAL